MYSLGAISAETDHASCTCKVNQSSEHMMNVVDSEWVVIQ